MATYVNDLRLTELATGEGSGTWGTTTNTNLELIGEALGYGTQDCFASDADATTTVADGVSDPARAMYFRVTSSATLTATRTLTIAPNTVSRVMLIENATTGSQSIAISQGSGGNVTIASGQVKMVYLDGAGSGAAVVDAMASLELGTITVANLTATTADINGGTIDGADITVGAGKTLDVSAGTFTVANDQISGDAINGGTATPTTLTSTTVNATTVDTTNIELTNLKAKDGTAAGSIADSTGVVTLASSVLTTTDINGGTIDGVTIGGASAGAGSFTTLTASDDVNFDSGTLFVDASADAVGIGTTSPTTALDVAGTVKASGLTVDGSTLYVDSANNRVGIGRNSGLRQKLHIQDTSAGIELLSDTSGQSLIHFGDTSNFDVGAITYDHSSDSFRFDTADAERIRINNVGDVGIGTTSPGAKLDVRGSAIFNEGGGDNDFRVESDTSTHMLFVDAGNNNVSINDTGGVNDAVLVVKANSLLHPAIKIGSLTGNGYTLIGDDYNSDESVLNIGLGYSGGNPVFAKSVKPSTTTESAWISSQDTFSARPAALELKEDGFHFYHTATSAITTTDSAVTLTDFLHVSSGGIIANETGADADFRVESDTNTHAFFVQGSDGRVGIGTSSPASLVTNSSVLEISNPSTGSELILRNASGMGDNEFIGGVAFANNDTGLGGNQAVGIKAFASGSAGLAYLTFSVGNGYKAGTENMRLDVSGNLLVGTTTSPSDTGTVVADGIYLGGTAAANLLDDYEEGTFTANLECETTDFSSVTESSAASYTKVGRQVTFNIYFRVDALSKGSASGTIIITGLPFTVVSGTAPNGRPFGQHAITVSTVASNMFGGTDSPISAETVDGTDSVKFIKRASTTGGSSVMTDADTGSFSGTKVMKISGSYFIS